MLLWSRLTRSPRLAAALLGLWGFAQALQAIGALQGLGHPDEQFYLSVAVDTYDTGQLAPTRDGAFVFQKPPLIFWLSRLCLGLFGRSAAAARLPGALAAGLLVAATVLYTAEVVAPLAAPLAGALLCGSLALARFDRELMLDLPLAACLAAALWGFAAAAQGNRRPLFWAGCCSALCLGIKGPIGVAVLAGSAAVGLAAERQLALLGRRGFWAGAALGGALSLPWYLWAVSTHWTEFLAVHVQEQYLSRFESAHGQAAGNLLWGTLLYAAPFWPLALWSARRRGHPLRAVWPLAWLGTFYAIFALPKEHGLHYPVLVVAPLAALAAAAAPPRWLRLALAAALALTALALLAPLAFPEVPWLATWGAAALAAGAAAAFARASSQSLALAGLLTGAALHLAVAAIAPALGRPLASPEAAALGRSAPVALLWEQSGPYRLALGWGTGAHEIWGNDALREAIARRELVLMREHRRREADPALLAELAPVVAWRRTRPYLTFAAVWQALRTRNLDALGETCALYRAPP